MKVTIELTKIGAKKLKLYSNDNIITYSEISSVNSYNNKRRLVSKDKDIQTIIIPNEFIKTLRIH